MTAEIISIGTEILLGNIVDTNSQYIAQELANFGVNLYHITVVGDNKARVVNAIDDAFKRSDLVICTGGLGPTIDDITKEAAAEYFSLDMVLDSPSLAHIEAIFANSGRKMPKINEKQAYFPKNSIILDNPVGTAPGCIIEKNGKSIALLPGVPKEMKFMFKRHILPYMAKFGDEPITSRIIKLFGIGESAMEELISDVLAGQGNVTIAPYASPSAGETIIRLTARAKTPLAANLMIDKQYNIIHARLKAYIYGLDDDTLPKLLVSNLIENNLTIAAAESFTGGGFAKEIVKIPDASKVLLESIVAYSNEAKIKRLGVSKESLANYGAVSGEVAAEMAKGAAENLGANIGISFTGIAGPGGATETKPVGLYYIGIYYNGKTKTYKYNLKNTREYIMNRAINEGLFLLLSVIKGEAK